MICRLSVFVFCACCLVPFTASSQTKGQPPGSIQGIVLEISIVEMTSAQPGVLQSIENSSDQLARLVNEGKARLNTILQVRTRPGESFSARAGQRVPIQTAMLPAFTTDRTRSDARGPNQSPATALAAPQIAYESTGLIVEGSVTETSDGLLDIRLKVEMSGVDRSTGSFTPTFTQQTFADVVRMRQSETALLVGLIQQAPPVIAGGSGATSLSRGSFMVLLTTKPVK